MHVFVESNFVLELAFRQAEYTFCEQIRQGAVSTAYSLQLPHYALTEVFEKLRPLRNEWERYQEYLLKEITQHRREAESDASAMDDLTLALTTLLSERTRTQTQRLYAIAGELSQVATLVPLAQAVIEEAFEKAQLYNLTPQDSLIYASVLAGLRSMPTDTPKLFVLRNEKDFGKPGIRAELSALGCAYLVSFQAAAGRLRAYANRAS
ncbi:hypothetical protein [Hymenobacter psoromatis]|uniref:hypothetical protein n=1 Tax=Hymenobacter psoromatis TaxID=1484116 RepID=UPI001CBF9CD2|nr:hypothetical protein [Hymenobacter psoromatis]